MSDPQPSRIIAVIEAQRAALLARDTATLQRYVSQWRDVESAIRDSAELLANDMVASIRAGKTVSQNKLYQLERYNALLQQTRQQIQEYARQLAPQIEAEQASLWQQGQLDANDQIAAIVGASFSRLPIEATNAMIGLTSDGSPLRNTLLSNWPNAVDAITRELLRGVALGTSPRLTARRAAAASQASLRQMLSVARTEQLRAYRESSRDLYNRSGVVKQYKRLASKNARTCVLCLADDGTIYKVSEPLPIHVNCRCTAIPIVDGYNIETGKDGAEWFAAQSADTQRQMLGPSRYAMYKDGTPLSAFVSKHNDPTWGAQLTQRRLDQTASASLRLTALEARRRIIEIDDKIRPRIDKLNAQINETQKRTPKAGDKPFANFDEAQKLRKERDELLHNSSTRNALNKITHASDSAAFRVGNVLGNASDADKAKALSTIDRVRSFFGSGKLDNVRLGVSVDSRTQRATARTSNGETTINLSVNEKDKHVIHELAHILSNTNPDIARRLIEFRERRTRGETPVSMQSLYPRGGYAPDEVTKPDNFLHPYVGKVYRNDSGEEVLSMGLEWMYDDPGWFARNDPEHFDLIWDIMRGE